MSESTFMIILGILASAIGKLWLDAKAIDAKYKELIADHASCKVEIASLTAKLTIFQRDLDVMEHASFDLKVNPNDPIVVTENGIIIKWNAAATELFGYAATEAVGKPNSAVYVPADLRVAHERALANIQGMEKDVFTQVVNGTRVLAKSGKEITVDVNVQGRRFGENWILTSIFQPR